MIYVIYVPAHLPNVILVILKQIGSVSLEINSIDFPLRSPWVSLSIGYYLIRSEEAPVRYM